MLEWVFIEFKKWQEVKIRENKKKKCNLDGKVTQKDKSATFFISLRLMGHVEDRAEGR